MSATKRKKSNRKKRLSLGMVKRWGPPAFLLLFFFLSVSMAFYVIFFRTVLAQGYDSSEPGQGVSEDKHISDPAITRIVEKKAIPSSSKPVIAIIIDDMGHDKKLGQQFLDLNLELSFSFLPFAPFTNELDELAYKAGRTVLLHLPLEPDDMKWDPGPGALYIRQDENRARQQFEADLVSVPHATGLNNHMGSRYTENEEAMEKLLTMAKEKELFFVDSFTSSKSLGMNLAMKLGVKTARRHVFLDNIHDKEKVCEQIAKLVEMAEQKGAAIGIGHPSEDTLTGLSQCLEQYLSRVDLVSVREILK